MTLASASPTLYRRLAADYSLAMELGTLKAGERMPSVRELMRRHEVSLSRRCRRCGIWRTWASSRPARAWATSCAMPGLQAWPRPASPT